jgi:hypothetical protein
LQSIAADTIARRAAMLAAFALFAIILTVTAVAGSSQLRQDAAVKAEHGKVLAGCVYSCSSGDWNGNKRR